MKRYIAYLCDSHFERCLDPPPKFAGVTGAAFILPGLVESYLFVPLVIQAVVTYMSDYATCGVSSWWHAVDRVYAKLMFAHVVSVCAARHGVLPTLLSMLPALVCYAGSRMAIRSKDGRAYDLLHGGWHVAIGVASAWMLAKK